MFKEALEENVVNAFRCHIHYTISTKKSFEFSHNTSQIEKKSHRYKFHFLFENKRPQLCVDATKFLLTKPDFASYISQGLDLT